MILLYLLPHMYESPLHKFCGGRGIGIRGIFLAGASLKKQNAREKGQQLLKENLRTIDYTNLEEQIKKHPWNQYIPFHTIRKISTRPRSFLKGAAVFSLKTMKSRFRFHFFSEEDRIILNDFLITRCP